jgi:hypothetical protein
MLRKIRWRWWGHSSIFTFWIESEKSLREFNDTHWNAVIIEELEIADGYKGYVPTKRQTRGTYK